jgi:hypothetical protein
VDIGFLEEDHSSEWASIFPSFAIPKKNRASTISMVADFRKLNSLLKHRMSYISYSKNFLHDLFDGRAFLCFSIGFENGLSSH